MIENYITGAGGFVGRHLASKLMNYISIPHHQLPMWPLKHFEHFYFLGAYGNLANQTEIADVLQSNIMDLTLILQKILVNTVHCKLFLYASSSSVLLPVQTPYSRTKAAGEQIIQSVTEIPTCIVRPYSVTGVGEQEQHLIPSLIRSCLRGEQMNLVLDATHDFVDVDDVVSALLLFAEQQATGIFELGTGAATTNEAVLNIVESACGKDANVRIVKSMRAYDTKDWCCKNTRARELGWKPRKTLEQSVKEMVEHFG